MTFYPSDNNFTQALFVMLVTNIISVQIQMKIQLQLQTQIQMQESAQVQHCLTPPSTQQYNRTCILNQQVA